MKVIKAYPPNFVELTKVFPIKGRPGIIYAYGDRIYNPSGVNITPWIAAHEEVHCHRQKTLTYSDIQGGGVEDWWDRYIVDTEFRFHEELLAHKAEWKKYREVMNILGKDGGYIDIVAKRLSSPLYGSLVSFERAKELIEQ